jgi:single-strand DNA-binding protein
MGKDIEISYAKDGKPYGKFSLVTERWAKDAEGKNLVDWHNCSFFGERAEKLGPYLKKGTLIYLEGRVEYNRYINKEGNETVATNITVENVTILPNPKKDEYPF